jgi:microcystin-dependent protein
MGTKITALPQVVTPKGTDELPISQDTGVGGRITYKATLDQIKGYVGGIGGSVNSVGINSTDGSIGVFGSPITSSGTISLSISSVQLDKLDDGGATGGEVLTYNSSTSAWEPGYGGSSGIIPNILVGNGGTTYTLTNYTDDTTSNYLVFVGGVAQRPVTDFTISGSSIIFGSNIPSGVQILVYVVVNIAYLNLDSTPIGTVSWFAASAAPTSYLECSGGVVAISDYLDLYYVIGTKYNTGGEGAGNFRLPDLRGEFIRGWDHGRGVNAGRVFGSTELDAFQGHWHELYAQAGASNASVNSSSNGIPNTPLPADLVRNPVTDGVNGTPRTASETRPRNVALLPCIKALKTVTGNVNTLNFIEKPASPLSGDILTYNGSTNTWVASAAPQLGGIGTIRAWCSWVEPASGFLSMTTATGLSGVGVSSVTKTSLTDDDRFINFSTPIVGAYTVIANCRLGINVASYTNSYAPGAIPIDENSCVVYHYITSSGGTYPAYYSVIIVQ